jgi:hypothetical protein
VGKIVEGLAQILLRQPREAEIFEKALTRRGYAASKSENTTTPG